MNIVIKIGKDLTHQDIVSFDLVVQSAFTKKTLSMQSLFSPENSHFFLYDKSALVAVARYVKVSNIESDHEKWPATVWGRSLVAVMPNEWGNGYGRAIVGHMVAYAKERQLSDVGIHGKTANVGAGENSKSLSQFYNDCGLSIDEELGSRLAVATNGVPHYLSHTNISYREGDQFIEWCRQQEGCIKLPFSW